MTGNHPIRQTPKGPAASSTLSVLCLPKRPPFGEASETQARVTTTYIVDTIRSDVQSVQLVLYATPGVINITERCCACMQVRWGLHCQMDVRSMAELMLLSQDLEYCLHLDIIVLDIIVFPVPSTAGWNIRIGCIYPFKIILGS